MLPSSRIAHPVLRVAGEMELGNTAGAWLREEGPRTTADQWETLLAAHWAIYFGHSSNSETDVTRCRPEKDVEELQYDVGGGVCCNRPRSGNAPNPLAPGRK